MRSAARTSHVERVMGTVVSFDLRGAGDHAAAISDAVAWFHAVDARFSTYRDGSEVLRLRRGELGADDLSADLAEVVLACDVLEAESGGAFGVHLPGGFDPSGYVKGWSVDRAAAILRAYGCEDWCINAGGDVLVSTASDTADPWRIGVRHPFDAGAIATVVAGRRLAVATSGRYERGDHVIDPRTGRAAVGAVSATVSGPDLGLADALATAALVLGEDGPAWVAGLPGYECWSVLPDGRVLATGGFPALVQGVPVATSPVDPLGRAA